MPIKYVKGDLFAIENLPALAHGCNCKGVMGKGIAQEFKRRFTGMYPAYRQRCLDGEFQLGDVFVWGENPVVFNLATQSKPGPYADLTAIEQALKQMTTRCAQLNLTRVGLPHIGAGLGGLDWVEVQTILENIAQHTEVELVVVEFAPHTAGQDPKSD